MIGMVTSCTGKQTLLPALLQWNIKRTDGEPCDSFSVQFLCGKTTKELLEQATEFRATEKGKPHFKGRQFYGFHRLRIRRRHPEVQLKKMRKHSSCNPWRRYSCRDSKCSRHRY